MMSSDEINGNLRVIGCGHRNAALYNAHVDDGVGRWTVHAALAYIGKRFLICPTGITADDAMQAKSDRLKRIADRKIDC